MLEANYTTFEPTISGFAPTRKGEDGPPNVEESRIWQLLCRAHGVIQMIVKSFEPHEPLDLEMQEAGIQVYPDLGFVARIKSQPLCTAHNNDKVASVDLSAVREVAHRRIWGEIGDILIKNITDAAGAWHDADDVSDAVSDMIVTDYPHLLSRDIWQEAAEQVKEKTGSRAG